MSITLNEAQHISSDEYVKEFFASLFEACQDINEELGEERAKKSYEKCIGSFLHDLFDCYRSRLISRTRYHEIVRLARAYIEQRNLKKKDSISSDDFALQKSEKYYRQYRLDCLITPTDLDTLPVLKYSRGTFVAPETVDLRDYCVKTQDQRDLPWCAAFAACGFASNILWRKTDYPQVFDPSCHYHYAKQNDGSPKTDGTTLVAVLQSLLYHKLFSSQQSEVKVLRTKEQVKYAIHKFGCCLLGMMVTKEWYACNSKKSTISGNKGIEFLGGHAVLACGYTRDGIIIQNSWGKEWGQYGFALITWDEFNREFSYGAVLDNCLYDTKMN